MVLVATYTVCHASIDYLLKITRRRHEPGIMHVENVVAIYDVAED